MKWLEDILYRRHDTDPARSRPSLPLRVEALEDRLVPTMYYHGGPVLDAPNVHILYMGNPWYNYTIAGRPAMSSIDSAVQTMVTGNYLGVLGQYGVGSGNLIDANLLGAWQFSDVSSGGTMSSSRVEEAINFVYSMGWSHDSGQDIWIVMIGDWTDWSTGGYQAHGHFWSSAANDNVYYAPIYMRPILQGAYGGGDQFDKTTAIIAHETAEAATDPMINGWYGDNGEICDAGTGDTWVNNASGSGGVMVASYWLNSLNGPGIPIDLGWGQGTAPQPGLNYRLTPATNPSSSLDNTDWSTGWGTQSQIWTYGGGANQQWSLTDDGGGYFTLHPLNAPWLSLDDSGASGNWTTPVDTWGDNGTAAQQWSFAAYGNGRYDLAPRSAFWDRLDVPGGSSADGTKLWLWGANGSNAQQWQLVRLGPRYLGMAPSAAAAPGGTDSLASATPVRGYAVSAPGGDQLAHVQADDIFAGAGWAPGALHDASALLDQATAHLVAGAWSNPTASWDAGTSTTGDVEAIAAGIAGGQLSQPEADSIDVLYPLPGMRPDRGYPTPAW